MRLAGVLACLWLVGAQARIVSSVFVGGLTTYFCEAVRIRR